eukprot:5749761-Prymnesium_polylepis.1
MRHARRVQKHESMIVHVHDAHCDVHVVMNRVSIALHDESCVYTAGSHSVPVESMVESCSPSLNGSLVGN